MNKTDSTNSKIQILGDGDINRFLNYHYIFAKNMLKSNTILKNVQKYYEFVLFSFAKITKDSNTHNR